jgi:hypothetical protein
MKSQSCQQRFKSSTLGLLVGALIAQIGCGIESDVYWFGVNETGQVERYAT